MSISSLWRQFIDFIVPYADYILPTFFIFFVLGTVLAFAASRRPGVRTAYLSGFFAVLIVVTIIGAPLFPIVDMHKFPNPVPDESTTNEVRIVDTEGNELVYDSRAVPPLEGGSSTFGSALVGYDETERVEMAQFLVENANEYRDDISSGEASAPSDAVQPPRYVDSPEWTTEDVEETTDFETIRVYRETTVFNNDNTDADLTYELRLEIDTNDGEVHEWDVE